MATVFYPRSSASSFTPGVDPALGSISGPNTAVVYYDLSLTRGAGVVSKASVPTAGSGSWWMTNTATTTGDRTAFVSQPLNSVSVGVAVNTNARGAESAAQLNAGHSFLILHWRAGTSDWATIADGGGGIEFGTTEAVRAGSGSIISGPIAVATGDRLAVALYSSGNGGTFTPNSSRTFTYWYNGASGATGDTFITFSETITEQTPPSPPLPRRHAMTQLLSH